MSFKFPFFRKKTAAPKSGNGIGVDSGHDGGVHTDGKGLKSPLSKQRVKKSNGRMDTVDIDAERMRDDDEEDDDDSDIGNERYDVVSDPIKGFAPKPTRRGKDILLDQEEEEKIGSSSEKSFNLSATRSMFTRTGHSTASSDGSFQFDVVDSKNKPIEEKQARKYKKSLFLGTGPSGIGGSGPTASSGSNPAPVGTRNGPKTATITAKTSKPSAKMLKKFAPPTPSGASGISFHLASNLSHASNASGIARGRKQSVGKPQLAMKESGPKNLHLAQTQAQTQAHTKRPDTGDGDSDGDGDGDGDDDGLEGESVDLSSPSSTSSTSGLGGFQMQVKGQAARPFTRPLSEMEMKSQPTSHQYRAPSVRNGKAGKGAFGTTYSGPTKKKMGSPVSKSLSQRSKRTLLAGPKPGGQREREESVSLKDSTLKLSSFHCIPSSTLDLSHVEGYLSKRGGISALLGFTRQYFETYGQYLHFYSKKEAKSKSKLGVIDLLAVSAVVPCEKRSTDFRIIFTDTSQKDMFLRGESPSDASKWVFALKTRVSLLQKVKKEEEDAEALIKEKERVQRQQIEQKLSQEKQLEKERLDRIAAFERQKMDKKEKSKEKEKDKDKDKDKDKEQSLEHDKDKEKTDDMYSKNEKKQDPLLGVSALDSDQNHEFNQQLVEGQVAQRWVREMSKFMSR